MNNKTLNNSDCSIFNNPTSVAIVGASNDPNKIGGRPLHYMQKHDFAGEIYPINPMRDTVQGVATFPALSDLPTVPDIALIALADVAAVEAVEQSAEMGVKGAIVMSSGFSEVGTDEGKALQARMKAAAERSGMRVIGPNTQGLANFANGAILGFSTMFSEVEAKDGPIAIVSQSGAMCAIPYGILREKGLGVRYAHSSGNDADVSAAQLASATLEDKDLRLLLLYLENVGDTNDLIDLAEKSREKNIPVVVLIGGRSNAGSAAAASHTGALATERRVLDAFLLRIGLHQVRNVREFVLGAELYMKNSVINGRNLAIVSNSGAACVLAADASEDYGLPLAKFTPETKSAIIDALPDFASAANPVDVTAKLLTDSGIFGRVLAVLESTPEVDACVLAVPVAGRGYDVERFARDAAAFEATGKVIVVVAPQSPVREVFAAAGLVTFEDEDTALKTLSQYLAHRELMKAAAIRERPAGPRPEPITDAQLLNEHESLAVLSEMDVPVVKHALCGVRDDISTVFVDLSVERCVVKGVTSQVSHKSEYGLVQLSITSAAEAQEAADTVIASAKKHGIALDGLLVAEMTKGQHEGMIGGKVDPTFGPVLLVGEGGKYIEARPDTAVLIAPCSEDEVIEALTGLRIYPILQGVRGEDSVDLNAWASVVSSLSHSFAAPESKVVEFDANPVLLSHDGLTAVDGVITMSPRDGK